MRSHYTDAVHYIKWKDWGMAAKLIAADVPPEDFRNKHKMTKASFEKRLAKTLPALCKQCPKSGQELAEDVCTKVYMKLGLLEGYED